MEKAISQGFKVPSQFKIGATDAYRELNLGKVRHKGDSESESESESSMPAAHSHCTTQLC